MLDYVEYDGQKLGRRILEALNVDKLRDIIRDVKIKRNSNLTGVAIVGMNREACINWLLETPVNNLGHKFDHDVTRLIGENQPEPPVRNELLDRLEERPIPKKAWISEPSQRRLNWREALELMTPARDSILIERNERYFLTVAAKDLGYKVTYRVEDNRGVKMFRYWVVSHDSKEEK